MIFEQLFRHSTVVLIVGIYDHLVSSVRDSISIRDPPLENTVLADLYEAASEMGRVKDYRLQK